MDSSAVWRKFYWCDLTPGCTACVLPVLSLAPGAVAHGCIEDRAFAVHVALAAGDARRG